MGQIAYFKLSRHSMHHCIPSYCLKERAPLGTLLVSQKPLSVSTTFFNFFRRAFQAFLSRRVVAVWVYNSESRIIV
ncbi:hypothetical protein KNV07_gp099 [Vibrio phage Cody]|uniref:Uncharacterized protein n=1 Tax=Vibrio phage Cody TaxID=2736263 RepID=A0A6M9Z1P0_9CAUD|nr:hypothetical protein KNV07_gp011 [Vibrio phage Cody]YP_010108423.1 hypothetical protein KNV07_gp099 [Vibrio phage Cody]QKN85061.1 hypothetical protein CODY_11 [Vibrio phage Cody]QKN85237.1 hypothetical protein CODY_211 [Vibrio phage Cody]QQO89647.1 hypothetical protein GRLPWR_12 [Vibrio phage GRLPWR]